MEVAFYAMHLAHSTTLANYNKLYSHFIGYGQMPLFVTHQTPEYAIFSPRKKALLIYYRTMAALKKIIRYFLPNS